MAPYAAHYGMTINKLAHIKSDMLVDGIEDAAYVLIRYPLPELTGSAYKVAVKAFLDAWLLEGFGRGVVVE